VANKLKVEDGRSSSGCVTVGAWGLLSMLCTLAVCSPCRIKCLLSRLLYIFLLFWIFDYKDSLLYTFLDDEALSGR
jgi:hypothetical protein